jgi:mannose-6-phosphate isomerase-like protein (cupin superfamily)
MDGDRSAIPSGPTHERTAMKHKRLTAVAVAMTAGAVGVGSAVATPGVGVLAAPILARGTLEAGDGHGHGHHGKRDRPVKIKLQRPSDVVVQQVTIAPGGSTGWHSHPGPALVIVKSGSLTLYDGDDPTCTPRVFEVGGGIIDDSVDASHVHLLRNLGAGPLITVTFQIVPAGAPRRVDAPDPGNCDS